MAEGSRSRLLAFAVAVHALAHRSATQRFEALRRRAMSERMYGNRKGEQA